VVEAELLEALAERTLGLLGSVAIVPQLGGDEELVTGDAGLRDGAAHALLIAVDSGGVDVAVADFAGVGDDAFGVVQGDLEDAEGQLSDRLAVVEGECGNGHACRLASRGVWSAVTSVQRHRDRRAFLRRARRAASEVRPVRVNGFCSDRAGSA